METTKETHLQLTVKDLSPAFEKQPPLQPRFFHFLPHRTAREFQEATLITFLHPNGQELIIKDTYSRRLKK